ncbi:MAG TPA: DUF2497 domain-containing protein, partial [Thermopetrobacter sp.]|nr:DUF2497 domain-containing protein [Thermopetrobacter sp.]
KAETATTKPRARREADRGTADHEPLLDPQAAARVAEAFGLLAGDPPHAAAGNGEEMLARTAERLLRPMLRDWLNANLPRIVERLVREEIRRIISAGRS